MQHNSMDREWAWLDRAWVEHQRYSQRSQTARGNQSQHVHVNTDGHSGKDMTLFIILFVLSEYVQKYKLKGQKHGGWGGRNKKTTKQTKV